MSSDPELERLLRDVRETLPEPTPEASRRARSRALRAIRRQRPRRVKALVLATVGFVVAVGLGAGLGTLVAPSGTAAGGPVGLGFLPEPGWYALQAAPPSMPNQSLVAMAANVPFAADDAVRGVAEPSGLPYSTLQSLPADGIVLVATFSALELQVPGLSGYLEEFPLRIADASPHVDYGVEIRPERPLGQYQIRAAADGWNVDVFIYFGTAEPSRALLAAAQRQLDGLVVHESPEKARPVAAQGSRPATTSRAAARSVVDRTFVCASQYGQVRVRASPTGTSEVLGSRFTSSGYIRASWGASGYALGDLAAAARPGLRTGSSRFPGAVYASLARCKASKAKIPLTAAGLAKPGSPVASDAECALGGKALVRVRAVVEGASRWRRLAGPVGSVYAGARGTVVQAQLAVRDQRTGRPLAFATLDSDGRTRHWSAEFPLCR